MIRRAAAGLLAGAILISPLTSAVGAVVPAASAVDPRIRVVRYLPDQIVLFEATLGYSSTLEFGPGERIENVSIGDSLAWQVTPNRRATMLFVKPIAATGATDMTVLTNLRRYDFDLRVRRPRGPNDPGIIFGLRFEFPEPAHLAAVAEPVKPPTPPTDLNHAYTFEGSPRGLPARVFDDGRSTYFAFADTVDLPAIFAVDPDKKEAVVNVTYKDGLLVVDRLAQAFVLRRGADVTRIINEGFRDEAGAGIAPHKPGKRARR